MTPSPTSSQGARSSRSTGAATATPTGSMATRSTRTSAKAMGVRHAGSYVDDGFRLDVWERT